MYLLDTNIWLELLLEQERADEVRKFFEATPTEQIYLTDFSLHSIGVILIRLKKGDLFVIFIQDVLIKSQIKPIGLDAIDMVTLSKISDQYNLDFDDAYQYQIAEENNLTLVSFDSDFLKTKNGAKRPGQLME